MDSGIGRVLRAAFSAAALFAIVFFLASCSSVRQSAFQGRIQGSATSTTYLEIAPSDVSIRLSGSVVLESGDCLLSLKDPAGRVVLERRLSADSGQLPLRVDLDESIQGAAGVWLLEIGGTDKDAAGSYDLVLSNR